MKTQLCMENTRLEELLQRNGTATEMMNKIFDIRKRKKNASIQCEIN